MHKVYRQRKVVDISVGHDAIVRRRDVAVETRGASAGGKRSSGGRAGVDTRGGDQNGGSGDGSGNG